MGCVLGNGCSEDRAALIPVCHKPTPEISAFAGSPNGSPGAADQGEVQKDDRIGTTKPDLHSVVAPEVTFDDPSVPRHQLLLHRHPLLPRHCDKSGLPENFIYFRHRQPGDLA